MRMKQTKRSTILGANCRLANAKSSMLQDNNLDAACMYEIHAKGRRERAVLNLFEMETEGKSFPHHISAV